MGLIRTIGGSDPKYLTATDILIGDMSDINYEFLLFDRPIILLANEWLRENFPHIGIKTDLEGLASAIERSIAHPDEYGAQRGYWHKKTMYNPDGRSSQRVLDAILRRSGIVDPHIVFVTGGDPVIEGTIYPVMAVAQERGIQVACVEKGPIDQDHSRVIYVGAHNGHLKFEGGYKVHLDHGLKGTGVLDLEYHIAKYKENNYCPNTDLHITEGEVSFETTKILLDPYSDRTVMVGYPKSDTLLKLNTSENRRAVFKELRFNPEALLITYAPAGPMRLPAKPGGSYSLDVVSELKRIVARSGHNILVKLKYPQPTLMQRVRRRLGRELRKVLPARTRR